MQYENIIKKSFLEKSNYNIGYLITGFHRRLNKFSVFIPSIPFIPVNFNKGIVFN